jgi:hypothetical protein
MKRTIVTIIATGVFCSGCALADGTFPECQRISPADAAALSVAQLKVRYCEAKEKRDQGIVEVVAAANTPYPALEDRMPGGTETGGQDESANRMTDISTKYASCGTAMGNIARISAKKGTRIETGGEPIDETMCN